MLDSYAKHLCPGAAESGAGNTALNITPCSTYFGLADLGFGCPELGYFSLREIAAVHLPFGLTIERDLHFETVHPLSVWADAARSAGSIMGAAHNLLRQSQDPLPPASDPDGSGEVG